MNPLIDTVSRFPHRVALIADTGSRKDDVPGRAADVPSSGPVEGSRGGADQGAEHEVDVLTWSELASRAVDYSEALRARGIGPGDVVATLLEGTREHVLLLHAIWLCGGTVAPLNLRLAPTELQRQLAQVRPALLIRDDAVQPLSPTETDIPVVLPDDLRSDAARGDAASFIPHEAKGEERCSILFTSGTSGTSRPIAHSWDNHRAAAAASAANLAEGESDTWQCVIPLYHIGGLAILLRSMFSGMTVRLHARFDACAVQRAILEDHVTITSLVPTMLHRMLAADPDFRAVRVPRLRAILLGGAPAPSSLWDEALRRGLPVLGTYGMTETCAQVATGSPASITEHARTAGRPLLGVRLEIRDADGNVLPAGMDGEIWVRGPMVGSVEERRETGRIGEERAQADGWLRTGDVGHVDAEGRLVVAARREDLIVCGGENVVPGEIEDVLLRHPAVEEAAVVGIPDEEWGQRVAAALVLREACQIMKIEDFCRRELAGYKIPRRWLVLDVLPRTASGKLVRAEIREMIGEAKGDRG